ncbi:MAG: ABC transporter ATP-binding protein [Rhodospirillaceae bacterium]
MLTCRNLGLVVDGRVLCSGLDVAVRPGELWGVLGPNGSGKTTFMHALAGVRPPDEGTVCWGDRALSEYRSRERARYLGLLPQHELGEFWGTVFDFVLLGRYPRSASSLAWQGDDVRHAHAALELAGVAALAAREYGTLSGGERQRVRIAQLLAQEATCMLLDEPLAHLDLTYQARVLTLMKTMAEQGRAVVMVLHDALWAARACSHVLLLDGAGHATTGPAGTLLARGTLERLYGCTLREFVDGAARYLVPEI